MNRLVSILSSLMVVVLFTACSSDTEEVDDMGSDPRPETNRIPQEVFDQESFTASYMVDTDGGWR